MCSVSIIVPVYNALESARNCLSGIYGVSTTVPFEVIVVDNGSSPEVGEWLASEARRRERLTVLHFDRPLGFARAVNEGARKAKHEFICVLNSDTVVTDRWLDRLLDAMRTDPNIGIVSPVTDHSGPGSQLVTGPPDAGARLPLIEEPRRLYFFCVIVRRELWEMLGGLDEIYQVGTYEDDDFCLRARMAGWSMAVVPDVFVFNGASKTFEHNGIDRDEWLYRNEKIFLESASRLSRSPASARRKKELHGLSVVIGVIAVKTGARRNLTDSLHSLANQTVAGFEVVIVAHYADPLPELPAELVQALNIRRVAAIDGEKRGAAALWTAGFESAAGDLFAYLPAGDIYFPYHLEILHRALTVNRRQAACSGWSVAIQGETGVKRAPAKAGDAGAWSPMVCWMHARDCQPEFSESEFTLRLGTCTEVWFEPAITCERNRGVEDGNQEEALVVQRHEQEHRARRVRRLLSQRSAARSEGGPVAEAQRRLSVVSASRKTSSAASGRVDFVFFNIVGWTDLTQRPHHFASGLSKRGHRVFWVDVQLIPPERFDGTVVARELAADIFEVRLPGFAGGIYHLPWSSAILNLMSGALAQIRDVYSLEMAVQFVNFPRWRPLAQRMREDFGWPIVYDCLDDQIAFGELYGQNVSEDEGELTRTCDALITSGHVLFEMKREQRPDVILIPNAVDYNVFHATASSGLADGLRRPVIGFFGAFCDWLDFDWIAAAARGFPSFTFVYIGREGFSCEETRERWRAATSHPNVHILPQTDLTKLAACLKGFDVCTMPFQDLPITRGMNAVKIYEYLAAGKHVLVPPLPEMLPLAKQGLLFTYRSHQESFELLEALVARPPSPGEITSRSSFAAQNDWGERLDRFLDAMQRRGFMESAHSVPESGA